MASNKVYSSMPVIASIRFAQNMMMVYFARYREMMLMRIDLRGHASRHFRRAITFIFSSEWKPVRLSWWHTAAFDCFVLDAISSSMPVSIQAIVISSIFYSLVMVKIRSRESIVIYDSRKPDLSSNILLRNFFFDEIISMSMVHASASLLGAGEISVWSKGW